MNGFHPNYLKSAIAGEVANLASAANGQRNHTLFRSACSLASLGILEGEIIRGLKPSADVIGLKGSEFYTTVKSGVKAGHAKPRSARQSSPPSECQVRSEVKVAQVVPPDSADPKYVGELGLPVRTMPGPNGKPVFIRADDGGPQVSADENRRHVYIRDGMPVRVKIKRANGGYVNWYRVSDIGGDGWQAAKPVGYVPGPYVGAFNPFDPELATDAILWPEGEKDVDALGKVGMPSFTFGGTGDGLPEGATERLRGKHVVILADNDIGGAAHAEKKAAAAYVVAASVKVVSFPDLPTKGDVADFIDLGNGADDLWRRIDRASVWSPRTPPTEAVTSRRSLVTCTLSDIAPEKIEWLWPGRIAVGKLTLIAGEPGLGKSQTTLFVAASVTTGARWPDNSGNAPLGSVIILSAEDGLADTTRPRFDAAGGDASRVGVIRAVDTKDTNGSVRGSFNLAADLALLEAEIIKRGDVRLVIIDPVSSYMGKTDSHKNADVRSVLEPIGEMAERLRVAVLAITHLSKGDGRAINRFIGSIAFIAAARAAFTVVADADDEAGLRRLFLQVKNNIAPPAPGLAFRLEQREVAPGIIGSSLCWDNAPVRVTADQALSAGGGDLDPTATDDAIGFLSSILSDGPVAVKDVERQAIEASLLGDGKAIGQSKVFRSARVKLKVVTIHDGKVGRWVWKLPETGKVPSERQDAPFPEEGALPVLGHLALPTQVGK